MQDIVARKGTSKALTFSMPHVLKAIFLLSSNHYVSRARFCQEIMIGEGAARTLISHLKAHGLVDSVKAGTYLTDKGRRLTGQFQKILPSQTFLRENSTTKKRYNFAILLKRSFAGDVGNGMQQRDYAILYGASNALTLIYRDGEFVFSGDGMRCFPDEPEIRDYLVQTLNPYEEDIIIITSSDDRFVAEVSAINAAIGTIR